MSADEQRGHKRPVEESCEPDGKARITDVVVPGNPRSEAVLEQRRQADSRWRALPLDMMKSMLLPYIDSMVQPLARLAVANERNSAAYGNRARQTSKPFAGPIGDVNAWPSMVVTNDGLSVLHMCWPHSADKKYLRCVSPEGIVTQLKCGTINRVVAATATGLIVTNAKHCGPDPRDGHLSVLASYGFLDAAGTYTRLEATVSRVLGDDAVGERLVLREANVLCKYSIWRPSERVQRMELLDFPFSQASQSARCPWEIVLLPLFQPLGFGVKLEVEKLLFVSRYDVVIVWWLEGSTMIMTRYHWAKGEPEACLLWTYIGQGFEQVFSLQLLESSAFLSRRQVFSYGFRYHSRDGARVHQCMFTLVDMESGNLVQEFTDICELVPLSAVVDNIGVIHLMMRNGVIKYLRLNSELELETGDCE
jgi:hypothetical protein